MVTTKADATGSRTGRARLSATTRRMMNIPIVADWAAVRQNRATSVIGCGSLTASEKPALPASPGILGFSTRRSFALVTFASMGKITAEVPFGCRTPFPQGFWLTGAAKSAPLNLPLSGTAQVVPSRLCSHGL